MSLLELAVQAAVPIAALGVLAFFGAILRVITGRMKAGIAKDVAVELTLATQHAVMDVGAHLKPKLLAAAADGKLTAEDGRTLKDAAIAAAKDSLSATALEQLKKHSSSVEAVLGRAVETAVTKAKTGAIAVLLFVLAACALPTLTGCSGSSSPAQSSATVQRTAALAFNGTAIALEVLDAREAAFLRGLTHPTTAQLEAATVRVERLERARDALELVRQWLAGERENGRDELAEAVRALGIVAAELRSQGVDVPKRVTDGLQLAALFLEASK